MTQEEIDNIIVDVIYSENEIKHVLPPNEHGVRGVPIGQFILRNTLEKVKAHLGYYSYNLEKITAYENELKNNQNQ